MSDFSVMFSVKGAVSQGTSPVATPQLSESCFGEKTGVQKENQSGRYECFVSVLIMQSFCIFVCFIKGN